MLNRPRSRRQLLVGMSKVGGVMMPLPLLPSLLPRSAWGAPVTPPVRFVQCLSSWGQFYEYFYPKFPALQSLDRSSVLSGAKLTDLPGQISKVIGSTFNDIKGKVNVITGMNVQAGDGQHNGCAPSCASGLSMKNGQYDLRPLNSYSIEYLLSSSKKVYPDDGGAPEKFVGLWRQYDGGYWAYNYAWTPTSTLTMVDDPRAVYAKFARSFNAGDPAIDAAAKDRIKLVQDVYQDYRSVVDSGKLSSVDRPRFDAYMTLISEVEAKLAAPVKSCADPKAQFLDRPCGKLFGSPIVCATAAGETEAVKILAAGLACQLTRVVDYVFTDHYDHLHSYQHDNKAELHSDEAANDGKVVGTFWNLLNTLKEPDGSTVLDNCVTYWSNNACMVPAPKWGAHGYQNMPLVTGGSAGGRLRTGYFLQYGTGGETGGDASPYKYNNWLVTVLNAMGLGPADYEMGGKTGFGYYSSTSSITPEARRRPLGFLWKG